MDAHNRQPLRWHEGGQVESELPAGTGHEVIFLFFNLRPLGRYLFTPVCQHSGPLTSSPSCSLPSSPSPPAGERERRFRSGHKVSQMPKFHGSRSLCRKGIAAQGTRYWAVRLLGGKMFPRLKALNRKQKQNMKNILLIESSPRGSDSYSHQAARSIVNEL